MAISDIEQLFALRPAKRRKVRDNPSRNEEKFSPVRQGTAVVYLVGPEGGPFKIGRSTNPYRRMHHLQCGSPQELYLCFWVELEEKDAVSVEQEAHRSLSGVNSHREWFDVDANFAMYAIIAAFRSLGVEPIRIAGDQSAFATDKERKTEHEKSLRRVKVRGNRAPF